MAKEKKKKTKKILTKEQKLRKKKKRLIIATSIFAVIFLFIGITGIVTVFGGDALLESLNAIKPVINEDAITPELNAQGLPKFDEELGCFTFKDTEGKLDSRNFKVLQLTDIHIGCGAFSMRTDGWTVQTVADLITREKPDLVVVTGDIAYPVPFQSATVNNKKEAKVFATLMEKLGVYWTLCFGNHDTENYSSYNREEIGAYYASGEFTKCVFTDRKAKTSDGKTVFGVGNFGINVVDKNGELVHTIFMMDSNSYTGNDPLGIAWDYDRIHDDQIQWYEETSKKLGLDKSTTAKSTMYFHIAIVEYRDIYQAYKANGKKDVVKDGMKISHRDGFIGEDAKGALGTYYRSNIMDVMSECGTTGTFVGHDHYNNASFLVEREGKNPIKLTYGMSIDYLAYPGIYKKTAQRGGRIIEINKVGSSLIADTTVLDKGSMTDSEYAEKLASLKDENKAFGWNTRLVPYWKDLNKGITL